jgi:protein SCO1
MRPNDGKRVRASGAGAAAALLAGCLALAGCGGAGGSATASAPRIAGGDAVPAKPAPPLRLTDSRGHRVDLASLKGRTVLVAFLYTHCHDLCPVVAAKIHTTYSLLPPRRRPVFLAVSVDPAHDTPASAAEFNREHRTGGEIEWLLGSRRELEAAWRAWHVIPEREKRDPEVIEHSADIYGIGPDGKVHVLYSPEFSPPAMARGLVALAAQ